MGIDSVFYKEKEQMLSKNDIIKLINEHKKTGKSRRTLTDESKTSALVYLCFVDFFKYNPITEIIPQKSTRGFIDYSVVSGKDRIECSIEVKKLRSGLDINQIRKYLIHKGRKQADFHVGILTNLRAWYIYGYSSRVGPRKPILLTSIKIVGPNDFRALERLIGASESRAGFLKLHRLYLESADVAIFEVLRKSKIKRLAKNVRSYLKSRTDCYRIPHNEKLYAGIKKV